MKRKEFIRIVTGAMEDIERKNDYSCNALDRRFYNGKIHILTQSSPVRKDYCAVFGTIELPSGGYYLGIGFCEFNEEERKQARLNALAMYLAQSLAFKTYKDL